MLKPLQGQLDQITGEFRKQVSDEVLETMARGTDDVRAFAAKLVPPRLGSPLPAFELPDADGTVVRSTELIGKGPLALIFYRGGW